MGGTGIRCLFDSKKNKKGVDTSQTKSVNCKGKKRIVWKYAKKKKKSSIQIRQIVSKLTVQKMKALVNVSSRLQRKFHVSSLVAVLGCRV